jgi:hypothetical protein
MTQNELAKRAREELEKYLALPDEEKIKRLIARGVINERGEVLMGLKEAREQEAREKEQASSANGAPPPPVE